MIDFAIDARRAHNASSYDAIYEACILRFRPIMMTTMAAILGAIPLAFSFGNGGEVRRPLGIAIVGGLIVSQALTLYTTPVVYLYMDGFGEWVLPRWRALLARISGAAPKKEPGGTTRRPRITERSRADCPGGEGLAYASAAAVWRRSAWRFHRHKRGTIPSTSRGRERSPENWRSGFAARVPSSRPAPRAFPPSSRFPDSCLPVRRFE